MKKSGEKGKKGFPAQTQDRQPGREHMMRPEPDYSPLYEVGDKKLEGRVAIITGGDSGIGRAVAVLFARHGADIVIPYLEESKDAKLTQTEVEAEGTRCLLLEGDLAGSDFSAQVVAQAKKVFGKIDILVNNIAQQFSNDHVNDIPSSRFAKLFQINIVSYFLLTQHFLEVCEKEATIINTTSVTAYRGSAHLVDYSSTKGAIVSMTRSLALQLAPHTIRVNAVAPGPVWTPLIPASFGAEEVASFGTDVPLGRAGQPNEIAPSYLFLASDDARYMTGQVLHPNGGEIING
jgi:NAD(P)-dependent dehydrogenase (short-subunit alcohol dehydrogenase family)